MFLLSQYFYNEYVDVRVVKGVGLKYFIFAKWLANDESRAGSNPAPRNSF